MRIWYHSLTVLENLPAYADGIAEHFRRAAAPGTEVVMHGMHKASYEAEYPGEAKAQETGDLIRTARITIE
jgi:allantoin racemase